MAIEGMSFFKGLFLKEKGTFGFLGALSPSKSPKSQKDPFSRKRTVRMTFPPTLEKFTLDIFILLGNTHIIVAHFIGIIVGLFLLDRVYNKQ